MDDVDEEPPRKIDLDDEDLKEVFSHVKGDKNRYTQIMLNFLSNSIKFSKSGTNVHVYLSILEI